MTSIPAILRSGTDPLTMTWDFDNRLSSADVDNDSVTDVSYQFDALGRRVARDDGTATTVFVPNGRQTIADYTLGTAAGSPTYTYMYASFVDEPVMRGGTGGLRYYHRNQQYSIIALTNGSGGIEERYAYSAYGEPTITDASGAVRTTSAESNRYTYTGREWDETLELYHYRSRMYDAKSGRFCSRDPIGYVDGKNLYRSYLSLHRVDPNGQDVQRGGRNSSSTLRPSGQGKCKIAVECTPALGSGGSLGKHCGVVTGRLNGQGQYSQKHYHAIGIFAPEGRGGCEVFNQQGGTSAPDSYTTHLIGEFDESVCDCLDQSQQTINSFLQKPGMGRYQAVPVNNPCGTNPPCNSNWTAKCLLGSCGLNVTKSGAPGWKHRLRKCEKVDICDMGCSCEKWETLDTDLCSSSGPVVANVSF